MKHSYAVNNLDDLEVIIPEEVPNISEFFYFPDDRRLAVNRNGEVLNVKTNKIINGSLHKPSGSKHIHITTNCLNRSSYKLHRIIARTFIGRPSRHLSLHYSKLEVNHIDGIRSNNHLSNLEWVVGKENILHSHRSGLCPKDRRVLARHVKNKKIKIFITMRECCEYFSIHPATLHKHLTKGKVGLFHKNFFTFKFDDGSNWKEYPIQHIRELGSGLSKICVSVKCLKTDTQIIFSTIKEASKFTKIHYGKLFRYLSKQNTYITDLFLYKRLYTLTDI